jgi:FdhD protein
VTRAGDERPPAPVAPPAIGYAPPIAEREWIRLDGDTEAIQQGRIAAEIPVALVYNGRPHAVMMCTPTDLEDFAVGFTITEGIATAGDIGRADVVKYGRGIELQVEIAGDAADRIAERERSLVVRTGCGLCGVEAIEEALRELPPVGSRLQVSRDALWRAGESLGASQPLNVDTHTIHAAAWADAEGGLHVVREDVGRHNAVDKVIGALARAGTDASRGFLVVTSRASYELVQKAAIVNVGLLAAVSRPTALAIQLADAAGITLVGLLRGRTANVYSHPHRVAGRGKR